MNQPTAHQSIAEQLQHRELEVEHLNAVNQELQDELTSAKLEIKELKEAAEDANWYQNMIDTMERM